MHSTEASPAVPNHEQPEPRVERSGTPPALWQIVNQTARRLAINSFDDPAYPLILAPFEDLVLDAEADETFDWDPWIRFGFVQRMPVRPTHGSVGVDSDAAIGAVGLGVVVAVVGSILAAFQEPLRFFLPFWLGIMMFLVVCVVAALYWAGVLKWQPLRSWLSGAVRRLLNSWLATLDVIGLLFIAVGIPCVVVYFFGGGLQFSAWLVDSSSSRPPPSVAFLGRAEQLAFICVASILPALLYFLFGRQKLESVRNSFLRDVMALDPNMWSIGEARRKYESMINEVFGGGAGHRSLSAALPVLISTLLITLGWTLTLLPTDDLSSITEKKLFLLFTPKPEAFVYGFLGAYFFALNMTFRRYVRSDLTPKAYAHVVLRLVAVFILVWVSGHIIDGTSSEAASGALLVFAFCIGILPDTAMALIQDAIRQRGVLRGLVPSLREEHPLTNLEGMNLYDQARLLEEGIENVENLAHHNLFELMLRTRIPTPRLVDLLDQAILYLHVSDALHTEDHSNAAHCNDRSHLRVYGIRTATDLVRIGADSDQALQALDGCGQAPSATGIPRYRIILNAMLDDEWMLHLLHWREVTSTTQPARGIKEMLQLTSRSRTDERQPLSAGVPQGA
jgi:hypothetical protein